MKARSQYDDWHKLTISREDVDVLVFFDGSRIDIHGSSEACLDQNQIIKVWWPLETIYEILSWE